MISLDSDICTDFSAATSREWLETNGIGGFACGTVSGANSRRYHGLLTAATEPPLGRITMLSKFEETLIIDGESYELSANRFPDSIHPQGYKYLTNFRLDPFPIWTYDVAGVVVEKRLFMAQGENTTVIEYVVASPMSRVSLTLELRPLLSFTDYHALQHEDPGFDEGFTENGDVVMVRPYPTMPPLYFHHGGAQIERTGYWYRNFQYAIEEERGFDHSEDLYQPFLLRCDLARPASVIVSTEKKVGKAEKLRKSEEKRRLALVKSAKAQDEFTKALVLAADQFIVARGRGYTVIAGYPWFSDWGRDTMIALPGLTLSANRPEIAKDILLEYSKHISQGMLPNRFPDAGTKADYNTVDASLWYFEAVRSYVEKTGDVDFVREYLYEKLVDIMAWHLRGTRYGIHVDTDGLLYAGEPGVQLTWMDAKIGELVITPRTGKPVEIQALWFNALNVMADIAERFGDHKDSARYLAMADLANLSFDALFWNEAERCLFDVVENGTRDGSVRPNQILAVSLHYPILTGERARAVVEKVRDELLTPVGLRSLSPRDPAYVPIYEGSPFARDSAYHQGTVWGWLIGPYIDAYCRVFPDRRGEVSALLSGFSAHLREAGIGQISEIFDAVEPHHPRGCFAQAWSVGEVLRALRRNV